MSHNHFTPKDGFDWSSIGPAVVIEECEPHSQAVLAARALQFNNNARDHALRNAERFTELLRAAAPGGAGEGS
ncbi:hypothetical protein [Miltoncostaea marina]|uniref:hypothetical protein n=1 Tax=Miltoncostaea marina TaxID=2843215 RepID=UPI001C3D560C|nr:hypothetical protein [Miltoncostaea marina]